MSGQRPDDIMLQLAALACAQTLPRVATEMAKAAHGPISARLKHVDVARHHLALLQDRLDLTRIQVERATAAEQTEAKAS